MSYVLGSGSLALLGLHTYPDEDHTTNIYTIYGELDKSNFYSDATKSCFEEVIQIDALANDSTYTFSYNGGGVADHNTVTTFFDMFAVAKSTSNDFASTNEANISLAKYGVDYTISYDSAAKLYTLKNISGSDGYFRIGVIDTKNNYVQLPFTSESFNPSAEFVNLANVTLGRVNTAGQKANSVIDGSLEVELTNLHLPYLVYAALGRVVEWGSQITIKPATKRLPEFDLYIKHGSSGNYFKASNLQVNSFSLNLAANAVTTVSLDFNGLTYSTDATFSGTYKDLTGAKYVFPSTLTPVSCNFTDPNDNTYALIDKITSFSLTINNTLSTDLNALDGTGRLAVVPSELEVTGSIEFLVIDPETDITFFNFLKNLDVGSQITKDATAMSLYFTINEHAHQFKLKNMYVTSVSHDVSDRGVLKVSVDYKCVTKDSTEPIEYIAVGASDALSPFDLAGV